MIRRKHQLRPVLEPLESVQLLSGIVAAATPSLHHRLTRAAIQAPATDAVVALSGIAKGTYRVPGGGTTAVFAGKGKVSPLGETTVSGTLSLGSGSTTGQLTIAAGKRGKIFASVNLVTFGTEYNYQITGGTKGFAGATGSGVVTTSLTPSGGGAVPHGHFALDLQGLATG